jgi:NADPH:quinone reductase
MNTMHALRFGKYGPPSVLILTDLPVPEPAPGEVRIQVRASGVNPSDVKNVAGAFHATLPRVPGRDYAGIVVAGNGRWLGKEVWGTGPGFGVTRDGAHAQFVLVPIEGLSEKPARLTMTEAATIGVPYVAAWASLVDTADIRAGETLLVTGVSGAVGRAATQIAHWKGAKVIGADLIPGASEADHFLLAAAGKDLAVEVKSLTRESGADVVLDCVGGPMFEPALSSLRRGGRQIAITSVGERRVEFDLVDFYHEERRLFGVDTLKLTAPRIAGIMDQLREGFDKGLLKPPPVTTWPLARGIDAFVTVQNGGTTSKSVLLPC